MLPPTPNFIISHVWLRKEEITTLSNLTPTIKAFQSCPAQDTKEKLDMYNTTNTIQTYKKYIDRDTVIKEEYCDTIINDTNNSNTLSITSHVLNNGLSPLDMYKKG